MRSLIFSLTLLGGAGCSGTTVIKSLYLTNAELIAAIGASVSGPACGQAVSGLKPGEAVPACQTLMACTEAICASPAGHR